MAKINRWIFSISDVFENYIQSQGILPLVESRHSALGYKTPQQVENEALAT